MLENWIQKDIELFYSVQEWDTSGGINFYEEGILNFHPLLENETYPEKYIRKFYQENSLKIKESFIRTNKFLIENQRSIKKEFDKIFQFSILSQVRFAPSIFNVNPRYIEDRSFQFYYNAPDFRRIIIHEILHFHYHEYLIRNNKKILEKNSFDSFPLWNLSEMTNVIFETIPEIQAIIGSYENGYPEQRAKLPQLFDLYREVTGDLSLFTQKALINTSLFSPGEIGFDMNESYDISTGAYLEEEQNEAFRAYFPSGYEPDENYFEFQKIFHKKWTSHKFDQVILSVSKIKTELRAFFLPKEERGIIINFSFGVYPFIRMGDRILCVPYGYLQDIKKLQLLICDELLPLLYLLDYLSQNADFEEKIADFSWRENIGKIFTENFPRYIREGENAEDIDWKIYENILHQPVGV